MKKIYIDKNSVEDAASVWLKDAEIIWAGAVVSSMSIQCKNDEYQKIASDYDIHFIFDDKIPSICFYTVPMIEIFAIDSQEGYIGSIGEPAYLGSKAPICYINRKMECFLISENFATFIEHIGEWKQHMKPYDKVEFFTSKEEAEQKYEFLDMSEFTRIDRIKHMERCFDKLLEAKQHERESFLTNASLKKSYETLKDYYEKGLWLQDYECDERGELPEELKRGVLSQDALYDLLTEIGLMCD